MLPMKYGQMRKQFLKEYKPEVYADLIRQKALDKHLQEVQQKAEMRLEFLIKRQAKIEGITETLKETDQLLWIGMMNNIKASMEEIIMQELIYI